MQITSAHELTCVSRLHIQYRLRQNGRHFADDSFKCIFLNENVMILIKISLKFILKYLVNNIPALVEIMAWHLPGDKPLSQPMMVRLPTHICVIRPQWVKLLSLLPGGNELYCKSYSMCLFVCFRHWSFDFSGSVHCCLPLAWGKVYTFLIKPYHPEVLKYINNLWPCDTIRRAVKLPWIFPGAPLTFNGAPGNIQDNLDRYASDIVYSSQH